MASPTAVNDQITDSVTQTDVSVLGSAPAHAMGALYQAMAQHLASAAQNAVAAQQSGHATLQAATAAAVNALLVVTSGGGGSQK